MSLFATYRYRILGELKQKHSVGISEQKHLYICGCERRLQTMEQGAASYQHDIIHLNHFQSVPQDGSCLMKVVDTGPELGGRSLSVQCTLCSPSRLWEREREREWEAPQTLLGDPSVRSSEILAVFTPVQTAKIRRSSLAPGES